LAVLQMSDPVREHHFRGLPGFAPVHLQAVVVQRTHPPRPP
jgi:hypothetical protein